MENWQTLNAKVLKKLGMRLSDETMKAVVFCEEGAIEGVLKLLRIKFVEYQQRLHSRGKMQHIGGVSPSKPYSTMTFGAADADGAMEDKSPGKNGSSEEIDVTVLQQGESVECVPRGKSNASMDSSTNSENVNSNVMEGGNLGSKKQPAMPSNETVVLPCEDDHQNQGQILDELRNVVRLLELKCAKQDQIIRLKDAKITALTQALERAGLSM